MSPTRLFSPRGRRPEREWVRVISRATLCSLELPASARRLPFRYIFLTRIAEYKASLQREYPHRTNCIGRQQRVTRRSPGSHGSTLNLKSDTFQIYACLWIYIT